MTTGEERARELTQHERYDVDALERERRHVPVELLRRRARAAVPAVEPLRRAS